MLNVDSIKKGLVIDHIQAGKGMMLYKYLKLDKLECAVAIIKNVKSNKMGKKDIIKVEGDFDIKLDVLGFIDPNITVNVIENDKIARKINLKLPEKIKNVIHCKNPRCITSIEQEIPHVFYLSDAETKTYRCLYCDTAYEER